MRLPLALATLMLASGWARSASADALRVSSDEAGSWAAAVAMLQGDLRGEGRVIHVRVQDTSDEPVECGDYSLVLDEVASAAFEVLACDPSTGATPVRLVRRAALFDESDVAPRPLMAGISAVQVRTGGERGGARRTGASELQCSVAVRPYLEDIEHGRRVFLQPGRFMLRPLGAGIVAQAAGNGWVLSSGARAAVVAEYEVVDARSNEVVVHTRATLSCGAIESNSAMQSAAGAPTTATASECADTQSLDPAHPAIGSTARGTIHPMYALHIDQTRHVLIDVNSDFDGEADVYVGCGGGRTREAVLRIAPAGGITQSLTLPPGSYAFAIEDHDRRPHAGAFVLRVRFAERDPESHLH